MRRTDSIFLAFIGVLTLFGGGGCNRAYKQSLNSARVAESEGDLASAVLLYRDACSKGKADNPACAEAQAAARRYQANVMFSAKGACTAGDVDPCLAALGRAPEILPGDSGIAEMLDYAGSSQIRTCKATERRQSPQSAMRYVACLDARSSQINIASYRSALLQSRIDAANMIQDWRKRMGTAGAGALLSALAARYDAQLNGQADRALAALAVASARALGLSYRGGHVVAPERLCSDLDRALNARTRCRVGDRRAELSLSVSLRVDRRDYTTSRDVRSVEYQSGTRQVFNPEFALAENRVNVARTSVEDLELSAASSKGDCEAARTAYYSARTDDERRRAEILKARACEESDRVDEALRRRKSELSDAESDARSTPRFLDEPVYSVYQWEEVHHVWTQRYEFGVDGQHANEVIRFESVERAGNAEAGVTTLRREDPSEAYFLDKIVHHVVAVASNRVGSDLQRISAQRRTGCQDLPREWTDEWLHCRAESAFFASGTVGVDELIRDVVSTN